MTAIAYKGQRKRINIKLADNKLTFTLY